MMAAGILIIIVFGALGFGCENHSRSDDYSERTSGVLYAVAVVCGWLVFGGVALIVSSVTTWLWRVMP